jgi:ankyrin repeat protein
MQKQKYKKQMISKKMQYQLTALHWAVVTGHQAVAKALAEAGADVNAKAKNIWVQSREREREREREASFRIFHNAEEKSGVNLGAE